MRDLRAGVDQLHYHGLAHNDLNPSNILLTKDDRAIIIDFDSCKRFGEPVVDSGTPGCIEEGTLDEEIRISTPHNDEVALAIIKSWLVTKEEERARQQS